MPPGEVASAISTATGTSASATSSPRPPIRRVRGRRPLGREEADRQPGAEQRDEQQQQQRPELVAGVDAHGHRRAVDGQPVLRERPQRRRHRAATRGTPRRDAPRSRSGTTANQTASPIASASSAPRE